MCQLLAKPFATLFIALAVVFSPFVGLSASSPAQAASNARVIDQESFSVTIEDVALCTKFKYNFDAATTWSSTGYETCASEVITTSSLPATLHFKVQVQSKSPDEFLLAKSDAYLISESMIRGRLIPGPQVAAPKWRPSPLTNIDGPTNPANQVLYGAFALSNPISFRAGTYSLILQIWNNGKLIVPEAQEIPMPLKLLTFTINQAPKSDAELIDCTVPDAQFPKTLGDARDGLESNYKSVQTIQDLTANGTADALRRYRTSAEELVEKVNQTASEANALYAGKPTCLERYRADVSNILNIANNTRSLIDGFLIKAEYFEKTQNDPCTRQSLSIRSLVETSSNAISAITNDLRTNEAKGGGLIDLKNPSTRSMLLSWNQNIATEVKTLQQNVVKLNSLQKEDPKCVSYLDLVDLSNSKITEGATTTAQINKLLKSLDPSAEGKDATKIGDKSTSSATDDSLEESDGLEDEEPFGELTVSFNSSSNRFIIRVESNLANEVLVVRASKKGAKALRFTIKTNEGGAGGLRTRTKLNGYTLVLTLDNEKLDQVRVK